MPRSIASDVTRGVHGYPRVTYLVAIRPIGDILGGGEGHPAVARPREKYVDGEPIAEVA
ncbi:MAG TPA: hypothetical protein VKB66_00855 [Candidatus Acidoferrum sp.]|nr:hypothetical protein [Candidatus Acidoferrum sp.]